MNDEQVQSLWQSQALASHPCSIERLARDADALRRTVRRRNRQESGAALMVAVLFGCCAWTMSQPLMRIGSVLIVLASLVILWHLRYRASARALPPERLALPYLVFFREELVRQRDAVRAVWRWHLLPVVPGMSLLFWGWAQPDPAAFPWQISAVVIVPFMAVAAMNALAARKLQKKIDQLDRLAETLDA
jgi:hypothetical protein